MISHRKIHGIPGRRILQRIRWLLEGCYLPGSAVHGRLIGRQQDAHCGDHMRGGLLSRHRLRKWTDSAWFSLPFFFAGHLYLLLPYHSPFPTLPFPPYPSPPLVLPLSHPSLSSSSPPPQITWTAKIGRDTEPPQTTIQDTNSDFEYSGTWTTSSDDIPSLSEFKGGTAQ